MCVTEEAVVADLVDLQDQPQVSTIVVLVSNTGEQQEDHNCDGMATAALHENAEDGSTSSSSITTTNKLLREGQRRVSRTTENHEIDAKRQTFQCPFAHNCNHCQPGSSRRTKCIVLNLAVMVFFVAVVLVLYFLLHRELDTKTQLPPSRFTDQGMQPGRWDTGGRRVGLELTIVHSLESHWDEFFDRAVKQWDNGSPDALNLDTLLSDDENPDKNCTGIVGAMKICNGYYGESHWRGVNKILRNDRNFIVSSAARMNDYYLTGIRATDFPEMAYTMCHEMGHGFGVPHSDENLSNEDLKNCMDYTMNPGPNAQPGTMNFQFLAQLYGTVVLDSDNYATETIQSGGENGGERRKRGLQVREDNGKMMHVPAQVLTLFDDLDAIVDDLSSSGNAREGWRMLHDSTHGEMHEIDAGGGYTILIHMRKYLPSAA